MTITIPSSRPCQEPYVAAVVVPTILRPSLRRAVLSVFAQDIDGHGQLLLGVDKHVGDSGIIGDIMSAKPPNWAVTVLDVGYSTSIRHGGIHAAKDGGSLRTILSYMANSRHLAYLDDDNWWAPNHLSSLLKAVIGLDYSYTYRMFVEPTNCTPLAVDSWESLGPDRGIFLQKFGGFIDPNTLMIDKTRCEPVLRWWAIPLHGDPKGMSADRHVFHCLRTQYRGKRTGMATCYYVMDPDDGLHSDRMARLREAQAGRSAC